MYLRLLYYQQLAKLRQKSRLLRHVQKKVYNWFLLVFQSTLLTYAL